MKESFGSRGRLQVRRPLGELGFVLIVMIVGGWLRFQGLGRDSLWYDEASSFVQARLPLWELLQAVARNVHPPLYYLLLHGVLTFGDSETVLRLPSALFGTLSIPLLYLLGRAWFSGSVGAVAALLLAVSPFHFWHSQNAKMYTLLTFEGILCWYLFARLLEAPRRSIWVGYVLVSGAILYTHYYGALLLLPQTAVVALLRRRGEVGPSFWSRWLGVQAGLALLFVPWITFAIPSMPLEELRWIERWSHPFLQVGLALVRITTGDVGNPYKLMRHLKIEGILIWLKVVLVLGLAVASLVRGESRNWRPLAAALGERPILLCLGYFAAPIAIMLAVSLYRPLLVPRHALMTAPALFLLVAVGLCRLLPGRLVIGGAAALVLLVLPGLLHRLSAARTPDFRGAVSLIATQAMASDLVLFSPTKHRLPFDYHLGGRERRFRSCPRLSHDASLDEIQECLGDARRVWVVFSGPSSLRGEETILAPLAKQFRPIRTDDLFSIQIVLYERVSDQSLF